MESSGTLIAALKPEKFFFFLKETVPPHLPWETFIALPSQEKKNSKLRYDGSILIRQMKLSILIPL